MQNDKHDRSADDLFDSLFALLGFASLTANGIWTFSSLRGEAFEWITFVTLGLVGLLVAPLIPPHTRLWPLLRLLPLGALVLFLVQTQALPLDLESTFRLALVFLLSGLTCWLLGVFRFELRHPRSWLRPYFFCSLCWIVTLRIFWWSDNLLKLFLIPHVPIVFALVFFITVLAFRAKRDAWSQRSRFPYAVVTAVFLGIVFALGHRGVPTANLDGLIHNFSFYIGPALILKGGGWLLDSVPAQYGFLATFVISRLPGPLAMSFLTMIEWMVLISAVAYFVIVTRILRSLLGWVWAGVIVMVTAYFTSGMVLGLGGPYEYPSTGPVRFLPSFSFVLSCVWLFHGIPNRLKHVICLVCYLFGSLWSSESFVYTQTVLAFVSFGLIVSGVFTKSLVPHLVSLARFLLPLLGGLAFSAVGISLFYRANLGSWPDWYAFFEFALAYSAGFGALPIDPRGGVIFIIFSVFLALCVANAGSKVGESWATGAYAVAGLLFGISSYFVSRSHENNVTNVLPLFVVAGYLLSISSHSKQPSLAWALRLFLVPMTTVLLTVFFIQFDKVARIMWTATDPRIPTLQQQLGARIDLKHPEFSVLIKTAEQNRMTRLPDIRDVNFGTSPIDLVDSIKPWLPILPISQFRILSEKRQATYIRRYLARTGFGGGTLVYAPDLNPDYYLSIRKVLDEYFTIAAQQDLGGGLVAEKFAPRMIDAPNVSP